ncbi:MAG TPA: Rv3235 family protein [Mycobacterium sp.]
MSSVVPVVDYEPPTLHAPGPVRLSRRRAPAAPPRPAPAPDTTPMRAAGGFADAALRRILEVIDRRRPLVQLRPLLAAGLVESLLQAVAQHDRRSAARLRRVRVQPVGTDGTAAEVAAIYTRDGRVRAIACRVEQVSTATGLRWQVVALHIG